MPIDPETGKATRVRFQEKDGKKVRVAKSGAVIAVEGLAMAEAQSPSPMPRMRERFMKESIPALTKQFNYTNPMQMPRMDKIVGTRQSAMALCNAVLGETEKGTPLRSTSATTTRVSGSQLGRSSDMS